MARKHKEHEGKVEKLLNDRERHLLDLHQKNTEKLAQMEKDLDKQLKEHMARAEKLIADSKKSSFDELNEFIVDYF